MANTRRSCVPVSHSSTLCLFVFGACSVLTLLGWPLEVSGWGQQPRRPKVGSHFVSRITFYSSDCVKIWYFNITDGEHRLVGRLCRFTELTLSGHSSIGNSSSCCWGFECSVDGRFFPHNAVHNRSGAATCSWKHSNKLQAVVRQLQDHLGEQKMNCSIFGRSFQICNGIAFRNCLTSRITSCVSNGKVHSFLCTLPKQPGD